MQKNNAKENWQPSASMENLRARAAILKRIRDFFTERGVMEVETPLLCHTSVTDPFIESIPAYFKTHHVSSQHFLQTSPEYAMKRLLANGCGCIYQITKAFRQGEVGRCHNPEFTMLEWYRLDFNHHDLMTEVDEFLQFVLALQPAQRERYTDLFQRVLKINPMTASIEDLKAVAAQNNLNLENLITDKDDALNLLMTHCIEPQLGFTQPHFIYDFPASQAALARLSDDREFACRFEVYLHGTELANGFHELQNAEEQRLRFEKNLQQRRALGLDELVIDNYFLAALNHGLPNCAGVALGLDRLLMMATNANHIKDVISFDFARV